MADARDHPAFATRLSERKFWKNYQAAYEECLAETTTEDCPWHVVPADDKLNTRLIISDIIVEALKDLKMSYPETSAERHKELQAIRKRLT